MLPNTILLKFVKNNSFLGEIVLLFTYYGNLLFPCILTFSLLLYVLSNDGVGGNV